MQIEHINPAGIMRAATTYSHVVKVRGATHIVVAGQVAMDKEGRIVGIRDIEKQTHQVLRNIQTCLEAAGASMRHVISRTTYLTNMEDSTKVIAIFPQYFDPQNPPPGTMVQVGALYPRDALIEVEVSAVID